MEALALTCTAVCRAGGGCVCVRGVTPPTTGPGTALGKFLKACKQNHALLLVALRNNKNTPEYDLEHQSFCCVYFVALEKFNNKA